MSLKYTIFIPAYNADKYVDNFCNNILIQTKIPSQIVIIDDTKNSELFYDKVQKKLNSTKNNTDIKFIKNIRNLKPPLSWNRNKNYFKSNLIFRMDVDDIWMSNHAEKMLESYLSDKTSAVYVQKNECNIFKRIFFNYKFIFTNQALHSSSLFNLKKIDLNYPITDLPLDDLYAFIKIKYYLKKKITFVNFNTCKIITNSHNRWSKQSPYQKRVKLERKLYYYALKKLLKIKKINLFNICKIFIKFNIFQSSFILYKILSKNL